MHKLKWAFGDYAFNEAMMDIARKLKFDTVYIKGNEKFKFISSIFPTAKFIEVEYIPPFKLLNNCLQECCGVDHGTHCARRKVHELRYYMENLN